MDSKISEKQMQKVRDILVGYFPDDLGHNADKFSAADDIAKEIIAALYSQEPKVVCKNENSTKLTDVINKIPGVEKSYWDSVNSKLTVYYDETVKQAYEIRDAQLAKVLSNLPTEQEIRESERKEIAKEILDEIEKHCTLYQWIEKPDFTKRHYPLCPTDFYELKAKYLQSGQSPKEV